MPLLELDAFAEVRALSFGARVNASVERLHLPWPKAVEQAFFVDYLVPGADRIQEMLEHPAARRIDTLDVSYRGLSDAHLQVLAKASIPIQHLDLTHQLDHLYGVANGFTAKGMRALADAPWAGGLKTLLLASNLLTDAKLAAFLDHAELGNLTTLDLSSNVELTDDTLRRLAKLPALRHLHTVSSPSAFTHEGWMRFVSEAPGLSTLRLWTRDLEPELLHRMIEARWQLEELVLDSGEGFEDALMALVHSSAGEKLRRVRARGMSPLHPVGEVLVARGLS